MSVSDATGIQPLTAPEPPREGGYAELPGDIVWIRLSIPGGLRHVNVWLLPARRGWLLVDTGIQTSDIQRTWLALEGRLPLGRQLQGIVVTHHHPDHFGMAKWLADRHGVPVHMTPQARAAANASLTKEPAGGATRSEDFAARYGLELDEAMRRILRGGIYRGIVSGGVESLALEADVVLRDAADWRVSVHDGHAPGHACLFNSGSRILVSGDQLLPSISSNVSLYPSNESEDPLGQYLGSLQDLCRLPEDTLVLPSHGRPFAAMRARVRTLSQEHEARLRSIHGALLHPKGTMEVADGLFRLERLDGLNRLLALTETLAHLRWLEVRGAVERAGQGSRLRWSANARPAAFEALPEC